MTFKIAATVAVWVAQCLLLADLAIATSEKPFSSAKRKAVCPDYTQFAGQVHTPFSTGPLKFPFQRPSPQCRTFVSDVADQVIERMTSKMTDPDLARLFENAFPNTLDTTVAWHIDEKEAAKKKGKYPYSPTLPDDAVWEGAQSFIVTGDINAEWLRDSTNQLAQYQNLAKKDPKIEQLILGAINTQAEFVIQSPFCNAFQPPPPSGLEPVPSGQDDYVHPAYEPSFVFECKWELDSLANFLSLANQFYEHTGNTRFLTKRWYQALNTVLAVLDTQEKPTHNRTTGVYRKNEYIFQRQTNTGTETLNLGGVGNPLAENTGLIRSAFRPSDDTTIHGFFIPSNAMMSVQLKKTAKMLKKEGKKELANELQARGERIEQGIQEHGVVHHAKYGQVYAFEVDGYGSRTIMDDANIPSLLSLPLLEFVDKDDEVYLNTRKMILSADGNPYYLEGSAFHGIGGPHIGLKNAWPMSLLVEIMTTDDEETIMKNLELVKASSAFGLVHESVDVNNIKSFTRPWFAWANSVFAQTIFDLAERKPELIFGVEKKLKGQ
jgi:hypothetical protein